MIRYLGHRTFSSNIKGEARAEVAEARLCRLALVPRLLIRIPVWFESIESPIELWRV